MYIVGLTGGIASGKSTVAKYFAQRYDATVICADSIARMIIHQPRIMNAIHQYFGDSVVSDGKINRSALRAEIMANQDHKNALDHIMHPAIRDEIYAQVNASTSKITLVDIPLLSPENIAHYPYLQSVICVVAPLMERVMRIIERDGSNEAEAVAMINRQPSDHARLSICDYVINNDSDLEALYAHADSIYAQINHKITNTTNI